jgi:hypothetical protein
MGGKRSCFRRSPRAGCSGTGGSGGKINPSDRFAGDGKARGRGARGHTSGFDAISKTTGRVAAHAAWGVRLILTTGGLRKYKIEIEINRKLAVHTPSTPEVKVHAQVRRSHATGHASSSFVFVSVPAG